VIEKYGLHAILKPFIHDLNILSTKGIEVNVDGIAKVYKELCWHFWLTI